MVAIVGTIATIPINFHDRIVESMTNSEKAAFLALKEASDLKQEFQSYKVLVETRFEREANIQSAMLEGMRRMWLDAKSLR